MKLPCAVVRDLLPLYAEQLTEPETAAMLEAHLADCPACARLHAAMGEAAAPAVETAHPLKNLKKQLRRRRWCAALMAALMVFVALLACVYHQDSLKLLPWQEGLVRVKGVEHVTPDTRYGRSYIRLDGQADAPDAYAGEALVLEADSRITGWKSETMMADGETTVILQGAGRRAQLRQPGSREPVEVVFYPAPDRVIYGYGGEQQVIYGTEADFGVQVLPRLALAYYRLIAAALAAALGTLWLCLGRRKCAPLLRQLFFAPLAWLTAQLLLKGLDATSFLLEMELGWILLMALAVYGLLTLAWQVWRQHRAAV